MVSVTKIHGGDAYNVIPQEAVLRGTIRAFRKETMALIKERIETISAGITLPPQSASIVVVGADGPLAACAA